MPVFKRRKLGKHNNPNRRPLVQDHPEEVTNFALIGAGYWAEYQLAAWREIPTAHCVAVVDLDLKKAARLAQTCHVDRYFDNMGSMFAECRPRFVDIVTSVESHVELIDAAAREHVDVICQKPLTMDLKAARKIAQRCDEEGVMLLVHENWRWQRPIRSLKQVLDGHPIGRVFRARLNYDNSFPVFDNQPSLKKLDRFILSDMGPHLFDVLRFLFGEPGRLSCEINRSRSDIQGEDVASVLYRTIDDISILCSMSYATRLEHDCFPETLILVEGEAGTIELTHDYWINITTHEGTTRRRSPPPDYPWVDPRYELVQSSMVDCHRHLLDSVIYQTPAETCAKDNLKTLAMVDAAYRAAASHQVIDITHQV